MSKDVTDFVARLARAETRSAVWAATVAFFNGRGFEHLTFGRVRLRDGPVLDDMHTTLPIDYWRRWASEGWSRVDPAVLHERSSAEPHFQHVGRLDARRAPAGLRPMLEEVGRYRAPAMIVTPEPGSADGRLGSGGPEAGLLACGGRLTETEYDALLAQERDVLVLAAHLAMARMARFTGGVAVWPDGRDGPAAPGEAQRSPLSPRETDCLCWLARGLRNDRIAERLGVSAATVEMHLARARRKLGARTREQALARAILAGYVTP